MNTLPIGLPLTIFTVCVLWNIYTTVKAVLLKKKSRERIARINASRAKRGVPPVNQNELLWFESDYT